METKQTLEEAVQRYVENSSQLRAPHLMKMLLERIHKLEQRILELDYKQTFERNHDR